MATLKLHGYLFSMTCMRPLAALYEKGLEFELVPVDMAAGEHKSEAFLKINPFGQVPALEDGDFKVFESRAITQYIAYEYADKGTPLLPIPDSKKMGILSMWMQVEIHQFKEVASKIGWEVVIKPMFGLTTDPVAVEEHETKLSKVLDVYEARLAQSKYLAGDCFTLADLHHLPEIHYLMLTPAKKLLESRPHVCAWMTDIQARPAWQKVASQADAARRDFLNAKLEI